MRLHSPAIVASIALLSMQPSWAAEHFHPKGKPPSKHTIEVLENARKGLPFSDTRDFDEEKKGFIAAPKSELGTTPRSARYEIS